LLLAPLLPFSLFSPLRYYADYWAIITMILRLLMSAISWYFSYIAIMPLLLTLWYAIIADFSLLRWYCHYYAIITPLPLRQALFRFYFRCRHYCWYFDIDIDAIIMTLAIRHYWHTLILIYAGCQPLLRHWLLLRHYWLLPLLLRYYTYIR
jgi:hypothetical protein